MKQIYEMVILGLGDEDVRLGETVQPDCVSNQKIRDQIKFSSNVRAAYLTIIVFTERLTVYFTLITFVLIIGK